MVVHSDDGFVSSDDSDAELQELFAAGVLKPGLNELVDAKQEPKKYVNNIARLKEKLDEFKNDFKWIERLDLVTELAPMAPEMALQIEDQERRTQFSGAKMGAKVEVDEFKRELSFHRQAQAAVLEGLKRLKSLGIVTRRPDDYFAEMAKTDEHMQKVRALLVKKQAITERIEKARKIREQRKLSKQTQAQVRVRKQQDKKEMMDEVKKFRKGIRKDLDFLDNKKRTPNNKPGNKNPRKPRVKRQNKDNKFGYGGKKRNSKRNTNESTSDFGGSSRKTNKKQSNNKRPGKSVRQKMKSNKRRG